MTEHEVTATIWLVVGGLLLFWRSRRKFYRLNCHGIEQFPKHLKMLTARAFDLLLFASGTASLCISALILLFVEYQVIPAGLIATVIAYQFLSPSK
jgi:hypothetical protein